MTVYYDRRLTERPLEDTLRAVRAQIINYRLREDREYWLSVHPKPLSRARWVRLTQQDGRSLEEDLGVDHWNWRKKTVLVYMHNKRPVGVSAPPATS